MLHGRTITSQLASIPGNGPAYQNMPMNGAAGASQSNPQVAETMNNGNTQIGMPMGGFSDTPDPKQQMEALGEQIKDVMHQIGNASPKEWPNLQPAVDALLPQVTSDDLKAQLTTLRNSLTTTQIATRNLDTGEPEPTASELADEVIQKVNDKLNTPTTTAARGWNLARYSALQREAAGQPKEKQKKKKTRGNPFRVLMGKCGKMLDHGLDKNQIVRYIKKQMPGFSDETIARAVDIVKDYNRKKHIDSKISDDVSETPTLETSTMSAPVLEAPANGFNLTRFASDKATAQEIYDAEPEWNKRSTTELMARAAWLLSLQDFDEDTPQSDSRRPADDKKGVATQLRAIRAALRRRDLDENEIP